MSTICHNNETGGGALVQLEVSDGFATGRLSVVCPDGWYYHEQTLMEGIIRLSTSPQPFDLSAPSAAIEYCIKERAKYSIEGDEGGVTIDDKVWEGLFDQESGTIEMITYLEDSAIMVRVCGEEGAEALEQIMTTVQLTWDTEQSSFAVCEERQEDFFQMRSLSTPNQAAHHTLLKTFGYDWCILFHRDGRVRAKFDRAVNCFWGDGFGDVVSGTWQGNVMTFTGDDNNAMGTLDFTLEGDILTVCFADTNNTTVTFRRSHDTPPAFLTT